MDRLWVIGWVLIFLGILLFVIAPLAMMFAYPCHVMYGGVVWIFPLPPIVWGRGLHVPGLLYWLMVIGYIVFIALCIVAIITFLKQRSRREEEEYEY